MKLIYLLFAGLLCVQITSAEKPFEVAALVDSLDFAACKDKSGNYLFDTETPEGNRAVLEHVLLTGANTILWRNRVGGTMRYQSEETRYPPIESPLDKRRLPDNRPIYGWLRYYQSEPDILHDMLDVCHAKGLRAGVHWPFEETHWHSWTIGPFNLEHPEYWAASAGGSIWAGRCSLAYPEVVEHKLRLADELVERGMDHLFIDLYRTGAWGPPDEFVRPEVERWRKRYGTEPPKDGRDVRWCQFVAENNPCLLCRPPKAIERFGQKNTVDGWDTWR